MSFGLEIKRCKIVKKDINKTLDEFPKRFAERFRETMLQRHAAMSANSSTSSNPNNHIYTSYPLLCWFRRFTSCCKEELAPIYKELRRNQSPFYMKYAPHQKSGIIKRPSHWKSRNYFIGVVKSISSLRISIPQDTPMALWRFTGMWTRIWMGR